MQEDEKIMTFYTGAATTRGHFLMWRLFYACSEELHLWRCEEKFPPLSNQATFRKMAKKTSILDFKGFSLGWKILKFKKGQIEKHRKRLDWRKKATYEAQN